MFSKITKSLKSFVKSDIGKVAIGVGASFLLPGIGAGAAASGTSLGGQILGGIKTFAGAAKAGTVGGKEGVKLEQQYLVGENGLELMSHHPLEDL